MAKNEYITELRKKAKNVGIKIRKSDYCFLDEIIIAIFREARYPKIDIELIDERDEVVIILTYPDKKIELAMNVVENAGVLRYRTIAASIPATLSDAVGKAILTGRFIDNALKLQITLENLEEPYIDVVMEGELWLVEKKKGKYAADGCLVYLFFFMKQITQIREALYDMQGSDHSC